MAAGKFQLVAQQAQQLTPQEQLKLIQQLAEQLALTQTQPREHRQLIYGEFRNTPGREFATDEDFKLAEWHPREEDLNGD